MTVGRREELMQVIDRILLRFSTRKYGLFGPSVAYQPLPWVGLQGGRRSIGTQQRLEAILGFLESRGGVPAITLDVGANVGYFSLSFAELGAIAYAVEAEPLNNRISRIASNRLEAKSGSFVPLRIWCDTNSVRRFPDANVTLCLSIWHHWVRHYGLDAATEILEELLRKTSDVLFFDSGENEMPEYYNLPFYGADARTWLQEYLASLDSVRSIESLGEYAAFMPDSDEGAQNISRQLFAVEKC